MNSYYENHLTIKKNKLCPFKLDAANSTADVPCNWHSNIEILLITDGQGEIQYGKNILPLEKGDTVIVNSGELHRPYSKSGVNYYFIIIDESFCKENGIDTALLRFDERFCDSETERLFLEVVQRYADYSALVSPITTARLRSAVLSLLINICSEHSCTEIGAAEKSTPSEEYVKRVLEYIRDNYSQSISLDTLANVCGITKYHLAREFKKYTGQTVFTYVNGLRCKKAEMMISEGKTVTEAAFESGFESISYFSRIYKKLMGISPSKSKNQVCSCL